ncbi:MAG: FtsX-like permease family protein [Ruminococcaceae bacterium]|nr:FtsX-like permease family protein [Oscillospiraceae bacterium]
MKLKNLHFLSKANIRGNKNSTVITVLVCLLVVAVTLVSGYSVVTVNALNNIKQSYEARAMSLSPQMGLLTDRVRGEISALEHVEVITDITGIRYCDMEIIDTDDEYIKNKIGKTETRLRIQGMNDGEQLRIIKGKSLDNAPVYSCLVPSIFYPFYDEDNIKMENLEYIDGRTLIGKNITVRGYDKKLHLTYFSPYTNDSGLPTWREISVPSSEFTLNVVGTYYCNPAYSGGYTRLYVSKETDLLITQTALEVNYDLKDKKDEVALWWNDPSLHEYLVVTDDYRNNSEVFNKVSKGMGYAISRFTEREIEDSLIILSNLLSKVGTFLTVAIVIVSVTLLVQSSSNAIREHKGFIGLMKAIGYKNRQIFTVLLWEQMYLSLRAFLIGGTVSTLAAFLINLKFEHGTFRQLMYLMDWKIYFSFLGLSALIVLLVPLGVELFMLKKLMQIEPREAMSTK